MTPNNFGIGKPFNNLFDTIFDGVRVFSDQKLVSPYPPYDIVRLAEDEFLIQIALAGFASDEITIETQDRLLVITGKRPAPEKEAEYVHRGIAARSFERRFQLGDYVEVGAVTYKDGLLKLPLVRRIPEEKKVRKIDIVNLDARVLPAAE
jgi:molecular chaperone IbpA